MHGDDFLKESTNRKKVARFNLALGIGINLGLMLLVVFFVVSALGGCATGPKPGQPAGYTAPKTYAQACKEAEGVLWRKDQYSAFECVDKDWARDQLRRITRY